MAKYRPKHYILYIYGVEHKACVNCHPQSRWELVSKADGGVTLANKHTSIHITAEDFEKRWVEVKTKGENR